MKNYAIWEIYDIDDNKLGLLEVEDFLDIVDVALRGENKYNKEIVFPKYIGNIER